MVDVAEKSVSLRIAHARVSVILPSAVASQFSNGDILSAKGPVFSTAIVAGTQAVKKTSDLIPFCHPLSIEGCKFTLEFIPTSDSNPQASVDIDCSVRIHHKTGVEMEALTGASVAALVIYDMCKALSHDIVISNLRLVEKVSLN